MKDTKKRSKLWMSVASLVLAASLLIGGGTLAYLRAESEPVVNDFKANQVDVSLTETVDGQYNIIPGTSEEKDPTVHVANTVDAYVFVEVTDTTDGLVDYDIAEGWTLLDGYDNVYYREVLADAAEKTFPVLKDNKVSYDAALENSDMLDEDGALKEGLELTFKAYAIQKEPFNDPVAAFSRSEATLVEQAGDLLKTVRAASKSLVASDMELTSVSALALSGNRELYLDGTVAYNGTTTNTAPFWLYGSIGRVPVLTVDGTGGVDCENDYCFTVGRSSTAKAELVVNGGTYTAPVTTLYCQYGKITVNGGFFACDEVTQEYGSTYLLNCLDKSYNNGTADIIVTGGTFVNFNPADNAAEGPGTNFVADGYTVESAEQPNGDIWYTVVPATA